MVKHCFCAYIPHRMFLLKYAMATGKLYNTLSFPVSSCSTSEILALVELFPFALLTDNFLVARYESCKESSVSVCHNSNFDLVNNRSRTQNVPRSFGYLLPHAILWGQQWILPSINPWKQHPTHLSVTISHSRSIPCLSITFTVSIILKFWLIAGSTLSYCPVLAKDCTQDFLKHTES